MNAFTNLIYLLRDSQNFWQEIRDNKKIKQKVYTLLLASTILFAIYGAIIGSTHSPWQMLSSAVKLPALYLITLAICLPTLYFFDVLFGSTLTIGQYAALLVSNIAIVSILLFGLAPIAIFILISSPATGNSYRFFILLNVVIFAVTGFIGIRMFYRGVSFLEKDTSSDLEDKDPEEVTALAVKSPSPTKLKPNNARKSLLRAWLILYGLIGSQMAWTLRPFFGYPDDSFELIRKIESNFYIEVVRSFVYLFLGS